MLYIETIEEWNELVAFLNEHEYTVCQMGQDVSYPDGFIACFFSHKLPLLEMATHNQAIHDLILKYEPGCH